MYIYGERERERERENCMYACKHIGIHILNVHMCVLPVHRASTVTQSEHLNLPRSGQGTKELQDKACRSPEDLSGVPS